MTVLLCRSGDLPISSSYDYWCAVGNPINTPELSRRLPGFELQMEEAFDAIQTIWSDLVRELAQQNPSAELAHTVTCNTNVSDFGVMLAWTDLYETWIANEECILVICDDPWLFRHLSSLDGNVLSPPPRLFFQELKLWFRGYLSRFWYALTAAFAVIRLRHLKNYAEKASSVLLVYGHPSSNSNGRDAYFGTLMNILPEVRRIIHVDCKPARALELAKDGRTASLHGWGSILFVFRLPFIKWDTAKHIGWEKYSWIIRRSRVLEGSTGQSAAIRWQLHCLDCWLKNTRPRAIVWPWENHGWERGLIRLARPMGILLSGYQHTVVGRRHWVHLAKSNPDGEKSLPDRILCSGEIWRQCLIDYGHQPSRLIVAGAHRFTNPPKISREPRGPIFLALPFKHDLAREMVEAARNLVGQHFHFLVKDHPMNPLAFKEQPGLRRTSDGLSAQAGLGAVVYAASTVGLEALMAGIPVVRFLARNGPSVDVIPETIHVQSSTAEGLCDALALAVLSASPTLALEDVFAPPDIRLWCEALGLND